MRNDVMIPEPISTKTRTLTQEKANDFKTAHQVFKDEYLEHTRFRSEVQHFIEVFSREWESNETGLVYWLIVNDIPGIVAQQKRGIANRIVEKDFDIDVALNKIVLYDKAQKDPVNAFDFHLANYKNRPKETDNLEAYTLALSYCLRTYLTRFAISNMQQFGIGLNPMIDVGKIMIQIEASVTKNRICLVYTDADDVEYALKDYSVKEPIEYFLDDFEGYKQQFYNVAEQNHQNCKKYYDLVLSSIEKNDRMIVDNQKKTDALTNKVEARSYEASKAKLEDEFKDVEAQTRAVFSEHTLMDILEGKVKTLSDIQPGKDKNHNPFEIKTSIFKASIIALSILLLLCLVFILISEEGFSFTVLGGLMLFCGIPFIINIIIKYSNKSGEIVCIILFLLYWLGLAFMTGVSVLLFGGFDLVTMIIMHLCKKSVNNKHEELLKKFIQKNSEMNVYYEDSKELSFLKDKSTSFEKEANRLDRIKITVDELIRDQANWLSSFR